MLPKINRIKKKNDFDLIFKKGLSYKEGLLILKTINNGLEKSRFGFITSQKVSKKATIRNKIRRRLSEIIRKESNNIKNGVDAVFISLSGIDKKEFSDLEKSVKNLLLKAKITDKKQ